MSQHLILDSAEAVERVGRLLPKITVKHCNGTVPPELLSLTNVVVFGQDAAWVEATAAQFPVFVRRGIGNIAQIDETAPIAWLTAKIPKIPQNAAPQVLAPVRVETVTSPIVRPPVGAAPDVNALLHEAAQEASGGDYAHFDAEPADSPDEAEELHQRAVRNAAALKRAYTETAGAETGEKWSADPRDLFGKGELPEIDPAYVMPELLDWCYDQHERTGADVVQFIAMTAAACASSLREQIKIQVKKHDYEWRQRACIWIACVGKPGSNKNGPQDLAYAHLWAAEVAMREESGRLAKEYAKKMRKYAIDESAYMKDKSPLTMEPAEPEAPLAERLLGEDMTIEGMRDLLMANPRGRITVYARELAGWLASFDQYSQNGASGRDRAAFLQANDGGPRPVDRAGKSVIVKDWSAVIVGGVQPDVLHKYVRRTDGLGSGDGLMQRFVFLHAKDNVDDADRAPNREATNRYRQVIDNLIAMQPQGSEVVRFSDDAHDVRNDLKLWAHGLREHAEIPAGMVGWLNKVHAQFARWCLIYACVEAAGKGQIIAPAFVSRETAERVAKLFRTLLEPHQRKMYMDCLANASPVQRAVQAIACKILIMDGPVVTSREIYRNMADYAWDDLTIPQRREVFTRLENSDWIIPVAPARGSSDIPGSYELHPRRCDLFAAEREAELARRAEGRRGHSAAIARAAARRSPGEDAEEG